MSTAIHLVLAIFCPLSILMAGVWAYTFLFPEFWHSESLQAYWVYVPLMLCGPIWSYAFVFLMGIAMSGKWQPNRLTASVYGFATTIGFVANAAGFVWFVAPGC